MYMYCSYYRRAVLNNRRGSKSGSIIVVSLLRIFRYVEELEQLHDVEFPPLLTLTALEGMTSTKISHEF